MGNSRSARRRRFRRFHSEVLLPASIEPIEIGLRIPIPRSVRGMRIKRAGCEGHFWRMGLLSCVALRCPEKEEEEEQDMPAAQDAIGSEASLIRDQWMNRSGTWFAIFVMVSASQRAITVAGLLLESVVCRFLSFSFNV